MNNNLLVIAAAGSGKTTYLVDEALKTPSREGVLITTYTKANEAEIKKKIIGKKGCLPSNVTVQTWFSFLLEHGVRPFQSVMNADIHESDIGFCLTSQKSGHRYGKRYWGERDFTRYYFTKSMQIYSDKVSKFALRCNEQSDGSVIRRIAEIFDQILVDEVQDLAGYDLELIKCLFKSASRIVLVGDPRQVTYLTHHESKYAKYRDGRIRDFVSNELPKRTACEIDEGALAVSHRNNQAICSYSAKLYPNLPPPVACTCSGCRSQSVEHEGVFLVRTEDVGSYLGQYAPIQLRWNSKKQVDTAYPARNLGESKGLTCERVLIYPTVPMVKWIGDSNSPLADETRAKLYVGITRARFSAAIVYPFEDHGTYDGAEKYLAK